LVPSGEELVNSRDEVIDAQERVAANSLAGQLAEPALNQVQPTGTGWNVVHLKPRMSVKPVLHLGRAMSAIVVHYQMQRRLAGELAVEATQEFQKLLMAMALIAVADDFAGENIQRRKQSRRTVSLIVMCHGAATAFLQRQPRLSALQSLNLALLVDAEH